MSEIEGWKIPIESVKKERSSSLVPFTTNLGIERATTLDYPSNIEITPQNEVSEHVNLLN